MMPDILMVESDHDMRNPADFLVLNKLAKAVFRVQRNFSGAGHNPARGNTDRTHVDTVSAQHAKRQPGYKRMEFQKDRMNDMLKQADDMAKMINHNAAHVRR